MKQVYQVGGSIRDKLLGLPVKDTDWVITGCSVEEMIEQGFQAVGKDFPVFLHPDSHQEYALARTERKVAKGYSGFSFNTNKDITIEQDLSRRDLTINAIAQNDNGDLIDPFNGQQDIKDRVLRHVSSAFTEDPVRVLRIARFAARFAHLGFSIAPETQKLIQQMGESGELNALVPERVWTEMNKALSEQDPDIFFMTLRECNVLKTLFPEIDNLFGVPQTAKFHPEIDTGIHVMLALKKSAEYELSNEIRFAVLTHDLGKANTPKDILPSHYGHEKRGVKLTRNFCKKWRVSKNITKLALTTCEFHTHIHRIFELKATTILKLFQQADGYRQPERFNKMTEACLADVRGRTGFENCDYPQESYARELLKQINSLDISSVTSSKLKGKALGEAIYQYRLEYLKSIMKKIP